MRHLAITLQRALWIALLLVVLDFVAARARQVGAFPVPVELDLLARTAVVATVAALLLGAVAGLLGRGSRAASAAVAGVLVGAWADLVFLRWNAVFSQHDAFLQCVPSAIVTGVVAFFVVRHLETRSTPREARASVVGWLPVLPLAFVVAAPRFVPVAEELADVPRETSEGHAVPRVLFLVVDTLRADALERVDTPVLDALAAESHRFEDMRSPAGWTLPSMVSLLTGVSPFVHGATERDSRVPDEVRTLAEEMAAAGYRTGAIGQNAVLGPTRLLSRGFDAYWFKVPSSPPTRSFGSMLLGLERPGDEESTLDAEDVNALAFEWLDRHGDEDFFLWLHYYDPHLVYAPPPELVPGAPPRGMSVAFDHESLKLIRGGYEVLDPEQRAWVRALYDAEVAYLDRELGKLITHLKERGLWDDMLVVFTSDHGEEFWEHEGVEHGHTLYEELVRVPLLIRLPGGQGARDVTAPASLENVAPSVLTLCGLDHAPDDLSGDSLFEPDGSLATAPRVPRASIGNLYYQDRAAIVFADGRYKYVRIDVSETEELYDLEADPGERYDLAQARPKLLERGRRELEEAREDADALRARLGATASAAELPPEDLEAMKRIGYVGNGDQH